MKIKKYIFISIAFLTIIQFSSIYNLHLLRIIAIYYIINKLNSK